MNNFYVYEHWRLDRDECFYVGKGKGRRAYVMSTRNGHHKAIQAKVSREGFGIEVRMVAMGLREDEAFALERERIRFWREAGVDLANVTDGGEGNTGLTHSIESREKISLFQKGKKRSNETRLKQSVSAKKRNENPEYIEKLRKKTKSAWANNPLIREKIVESAIARRGVKRKPASEETKTKISLANKGRVRAPLSAEVREKIAAKHRGMRRPEGTGQKISAALKGRKASEEHKQNLRNAWVNRIRKPKKEKAARIAPTGPVDQLGRSKAGPMSNAKRVICLDDGVSFESASAAAEFYNVSRSALIELCLGKNNRKSVGKKRFAYEDEK